MLDQVTPTSTAASAVAGSAADPAVRYLPEPATGGTAVFQDFLDIAKNLAGEVGGVPLNPTGSFAELINAQLLAQEEMQTTSMVSNIERSKHETKMTPIRNIRLS